MKKLFRSVFLIALILIPAITILADPPGPPSPGGTPVGTGTAVGAPIDNGIFFLLLLGMIYGAYKIYELRKAKSLEEAAK